MNANTSHESLRQGRSRGWLRSREALMKIARWIREHQIGAFFLVTFAIGWGLGFSFDAVVNRASFLLAPLAFAALCGPALPGIIISALSNGHPAEGTRRTHWIAFAAAWAASALVFLAHNTVINKTPPSPIMVSLVLVSVVPVAFVISAAYSRLPAVKRYVSPLIRLQGAWGWSLVALVAFLAMALLSMWISSILGRQPMASQQLPDTSLALIGLVAAKFLYQLFFFNATGEEAGWRGLALPSMQSHTSPLGACLVINVFWPLWHLFLWMAEGRPVFSLEYWAQTYLELLPATVTISWIYDRSEGSILVAGIAHAAANTALAFFHDLDWPVFVGRSALAALLPILVDRMWKKLPRDHPAVYRESALVGLRSEAVS